MPRRGPPTTNGNHWITEWFTPHERHSHQIKKYLVKKKTAFQSAILADTYSFGRCLILDGEMQSAQLDEFIYHESLVHPSLLLHPNPREVLVLGGGEGATVREILKHKTVRRATMVDIDGEVVDFCIKYLKPWHQGALKARRTRLIIGDAKTFVETTPEKFDIILSDLPSPIEAGPACLLYTVEFYKVLKKRLAPGGIFALQAGSGNLLQIELHQTLAGTLRKVFKRVYPYYAHVPSFDVPWAFLMCTDERNPQALSSVEVNKRLARRTTGKLKFYDGDAHVGLLHIPKHLRESILHENRVITNSRPVYFFK
jgi:spermidine synthase